MESNAQQNSAHKVALWGSVIYAAGLFLPLVKIFGENLILADALSVLLKINSNVGQRGTLNSLVMFFFVVLFGALAAGITAVKRIKKPKGEVLPYLIPFLSVVGAVISMAAEARGNINGVLRIIVELGRIGLWCLVVGSLLLLGSWLFTVRDAVGTNLSEKNEKGGV